MALYLFDRRSPKRGRTGATAIEFALCAQVLFAMIIGGLEFSRLHMIRNLAQDAAYYAARDSMVPGATEAEAIAVANQILGYMDTQGANVVINDGLGLNEDSEEINVSITVPLGDNALFTSSILDGLEFEANATMRTERYDGYYSD